MDMRSNSGAAAHEDAVNAARSPVGCTPHGRTSHGHAKRAVYRNLDAGGQPAAGLEVVGVVSGHAVGQVSALDVDLEVAVRGAARGSAPR